MRSLGSGAVVCACARPTVKTARPTSRAAARRSRRGITGERGVDNGGMGSEGRVLFWQ